MILKDKLKGRIQAVKLRKKLPKVLRAPRRPKKGDSDTDEQDASDSGPTYRVMLGAKKQELSRRD